MFVYKHTKTIEYVKKLSTFQEQYKLYEQITREFLGSIMWNFQEIILTWTQAYGEIFKSAFLYL